jgi:hypothetical protein
MQKYSMLTQIDRNFIYTRWPRQPSLVSTGGVCKNRKMLLGDIKRVKFKNVEY